jgi:2-dehydro-3-deoxygalactonokinase
MTDTALVGIDWGTSNRRAYLLDAKGRLIRQHSDECGILAVAGDFEASLRALLRKLEVERADVVMSGMVGSRNGWQEAPYLSVDHPLSRLPDALMEVRTTLADIRCRIVPGYRFLDAHGTPDVMRGEETQLFGALNKGAPGGWFLLPGTHSKWVRVEDGKVMELATFMTGELYALLSRHGTLAKLIKDPQSSVPAAFEAGLNAARHGGFTHTAFCCRALVVTDMMPAEHAASYLSGLLIGTELDDIQQRSRDPLRLPVHIIGSPSLAAHYLNALELWGISAHVWQPDEVYLAALAALLNLKGQE